MPDSPLHPAGYTLQDLLDRRLPPEMQEEAEARLRADPARASLFKAYRRQCDLLRQLGAATLQEPVPERLTAVLKRRR